MVHFTSGYNTILRRTTLQALQAITSTYHQCLKFPTKADICCIKGSQQTTQSCYMVVAYSSEEASQARRRRVEEVMENITPMYIYVQGRRMSRASISNHEGSIKQQGNGTNRIYLNLRTTTKENSSTYYKTISVPSQKNEARWRE